MDKQLVKKITTLSFLSAAAISYTVVNVLFKSLAGAFGIFQRLYSVDMYNHGAPIVAALAIFSLLQFNPRVVEWAENVIMEVSKVVWPSRKDTVAMTVVVCVFVGIASLLLVMIDYVSHNLIQLILG